jgi:hypothetical protein
MIQFSAFYLRFFSFCRRCRFSFTAGSDCIIFSPDEMWDKSVVGRISGIAKSPWVISFITFESGPRDDLLQLEAVRVGKFLEARRSLRVQTTTNHRCTCHRTIKNVFPCSANFTRSPAPALVIEIEPVTFCISDGFRVLFESTSRSLSSTATMDESHVDEQVCETSYKVAHKMMCGYLL